MQVIHDKPTPVKPWYREFWAWFILTPLIVVVIACSITVTIAVRNADDRVLDNYYQEGRLINMRLDEDLAAANMQLLADITFDATINELGIRLQRARSDEAFANSIVLELSHPSDEALDHQITLEHIAKGQYQAEIPANVTQRWQYRWYLRLRPTLAANDQPSPWRLRGEIDFSKHNAVRLSSDI